MSAGPPSPARDYRIRISPLGGCHPRARIARPEDPGVPLASSPGFSGLPPRVKPEGPPENDGEKCECRSTQEGGVVAALSGSMRLGAAPPPIPGSSPGTSPQG